VRPELRRGNFVLPTIFADVDNRMCIAQEEIFGPVLSVIPFETEAEAVALGNDVIYGLAAGLWTRDVSRALRLARQLNVGQVYVNRYYSPTMHESPAAGHKQSGVGGAGRFKYLQPKSVYVQV
jgi:acyl-CoA reductase-like NAD-dependent aldehyde dehydrogenase